MKISRTELPIETELRLKRHFSRLALINEFWACFVSPKRRQKVQRDKVIAITLLVSLPMAHAFWLINLVVYGGWPSALSSIAYRPDILSLFASDLFLVLFSYLLWMRMTSFESQVRTKVVESLTAKAIAESKSRYWDDFVLYLRPFSFDRSLELKNAKDITAIEKDIQFEIVIRDGVEMHGATLVALSRDHRWFGGVPLKREWQDLVEKLVGRAKYCIVIPSMNKGTFWEIEKIGDMKLFSKVLWLCPPGDWEVTGKSEYSEADWRPIANTLRHRFHLVLPKYSVGGHLSNTIPGNKSA